MKNELTVNVSVDNQFERCYHQTQFNSPEADLIPMAKIRITLKTNVPLVKIKLSIEVQPPLTVTQQSHIVNSLSKFCVELKLDYIAEILASCLSLLFLTNLIRIFQVMSTLFMFIAIFITCIYHNLWS